jgi:hypothetical protein
VYKQVIKTGTPTSNDHGIHNPLFGSFKANFAIGIQTAYFLSETFEVNGGVVYNLVLNDLYKTDGNGDYTTISTANGVNTIIHNMHVEFGISYNF